MLAHQRISSRPSCVSARYTTWWMKLSSSSIASTLVCAPVISSSWLSLKSVVTCGCVSGDPSAAGCGVVASVPSACARRLSFSIPRRMPLIAETGSELSLFSASIMSFGPDTRYQLHVCHFQSCGLSQSPLQFVASTTKGGSGAGYESAGSAGRGAVLGDRQPRVRAGEFGQPAARGRGCTYPG